jgi:hypothetical protein
MFSILDPRGFVQLEIFLSDRTTNRICKNGRGCFGVLL